MIATDGKPTIANHGSERLWESEQAKKEMLYSHAEERLAWGFRNRDAKNPTVRKIAREILKRDLL